MIIFFYGQDTYRMKRKINELIKRYKEAGKNRLDLKYFDFLDKKEFSFSDFKNKINQPSMFKENKLIIIVNPFLGAKEEFFNFLKEKVGLFSGKSENMIVFQEGKPDKKSNLFKFLKKNAESREFDVLIGTKLKAWIKKEFEKYKKNIEPAAVEKLIEYGGSDLWRLSSEAGKLVNYKKDIDKIISQDIEILVKPGIEADIFKTIEALASGNKKKALNLIYNHLEKGDSLFYLLSMINFQFRNLLIIKDLTEKQMPYFSIIRKSKLHPFIVKKSYYLAGRFSFVELKKIYRKIFKIDLDVKTGRIEPEAALELLIAEIR